MPQAGPSIDALSIIDRVAAILNSPDQEAIAVLDHFTAQLYAVLRREPAAASAQIPAA
jgi:hypothetical protein